MKNFDRTAVRLILSFGLAWICAGCESRLEYGQTNEKYKEDSRKSNTADRKPITYSRTSNFGSKNEM